LLIDSVAFTKPVTVTIAGEVGNYNLELTVYAYDGKTYAGYRVVADGGEQVTFVNYRNVSK
jgi:hypothetical protein